MTDVAVPTSLSFTEQDIMDSAKWDVLAQGFYCFKIVDTSTKVTVKGKNPGSLMMTWRLRALRDPNDLDSVAGPPMFHNLIVPKQNPDVPQHTKPKTFGLVAQALRAIFPDEIPSMPYRNEDGDLEYNGDLIEKDDEQACRNEVAQIVLQKLEEIWTDGSLCVDRIFYAEAYDNDGYMNLRHIDYELSPNPQTGEMPELMDPEKTVKAEAKKGDNGATGRAKPALKKGKKKTSKPRR